MGKIRRGGYIFLFWKGDHSPRYVHVVKDGKIICKWNLENGCVLDGRVNKKIEKLIVQLIGEGS